MTLPFQTACFPRFKMWHRHPRRVCFAKVTKSYTLDTLVPRRLEASAEHPMGFYMGVPRGVAPGTTFVEAKLVSPTFFVITRCLAALSQSDE